MTLIKLALCAILATVPAVVTHKICEMFMGVSPVVNFLLGLMEMGLMIVYLLLAILVFVVLIEGSAK